MSKKIIFILAIAVTTALLFTGCEISASGSIPPLASPTTGSSNPMVPTGMSLVQTWGTITAVYLQTAAAQGLLPASETPQPSLTAITNSGSNIFTLVPPTGSVTRAIGGGDTTPATQTTPVVAAIVTPGRPATYTLKQGEFPYCIARRYNVDQKVLLTANNLTVTQATDLPVGTPLTIPQNAGPFIGTRYYHAHPATFVVGSTDPKITTIYGVACYYGDINPDAIAVANGGLSLTTPLTIGRTLNIP